MGKTWKKSSAFFKAVSHVCFFFSFYSLRAISILIKHHYYNFSIAGPIFLPEIVCPSNRHIRTWILRCTREQEGTLEISRRDTSVSNRNFCERGIDGAEAIVVGKTDVGY